MRIVNKILIIKAYYPLALINAFYTQIFTKLQPQQYTKYSLCSQQIECPQFYNQSFANKISVGSHIISEDYDPFKIKKNIANQTISIFLNPSQNKAFIFENSNSENEIRYLNKTLRNEEGTTLEILTQFIEKHQLKNEDLKKFIYILIEKLAQQENTISSYSEVKYKFVQDKIKFYLSQEIQSLQKNINKLKSIQHDLNIVRKMNDTLKKYLIQNLKKIYQLQKDQLNNLEQVKIY